MLGDLDLELERVSGERQTAFMERDLAAEETVDPLALILEVCAHPADQCEVSLSAFDQRAGADASVMGVPSVGGDIRFSPDHAGAFDACFRIDAGDPVHQQQRRSGETNLTRILVLRPERITEKG